MFWSGSSLSLMRLNIWIRSKAMINNNMGSNSFSTGRPIDTVGNITRQTISANYVLISKKRIKAWKALTLIAFIAGFFAAAIWRSSNINF